jgi:hypothetical protein
MSSRSTCTDRPGTGFARPANLRRLRPLLSLGVAAGLRRLLALASLPLALALAPAPVAATNLEGVLSPGDVIQGHAKTESECQACHAPFQKTGQDERCEKCHDTVARDIARRTGFHGRIADRGNCRSCHTDHKGRGAQIVVFEERKFDHRQSDFALVDSHQAVACDKCHLPRAKYRDARTTCVACHKKDDDDPARKAHHGALGERCEDCHTVRKWKDTFFDHGKTRFALRDAHADPRVGCLDCHAGNRFKNTPVECVACHKKDDDDPRRKAHRGRYGDKCGQCHTERKWDALRFDHDRDTKYPLRWRHADPKVPCKDCHTTEYVFRDRLKSDCVACHHKDDKHKGSEGERCEKCHSERGWKTTHDFDHDRTRFPLRDAHADPRVACAACHVTPVYTDAPKTCFGCHRKDDEDPRRKAHHGRYGQKCEDCHTVKDWKTLRFDHDRDTKYPLLGRHRGTRCDDCHTGSDLYRDKPATLCVACHRKDDKHLGKEGERCQDCHLEQDWKTTRNRFDHGLTSFPLLGKHAPLDCAKCHTTLAFKDTRSACVACHEKDDRHRRRLGTVCEDCHNAVSWKRWDFAHDRRTHFALDGAHARIDCYACHRAPVTGRALLPMACVACHQSDDAHNSGFGRQCERCHVTSDWRQVRPTLGRAGPPLLPGGETILSLAFSEHSSGWTKVRTIHSGQDPAITHD